MDIVVLEDLQVLLILDQHVEMAQSKILQLRNEMMEIISVEMDEASFEKLKLDGVDLEHLQHHLMFALKIEEMEEGLTLLALTEMTEIQYQETDEVQHDLKRLDGYDLEEQFQKVMFEQKYEETVFGLIHWPLIETMEIL